MAKQQQFLDLFAKYDEDADGQIDQQQFIQLITELEVPYQYPGTVTKIIRKLNYANPDKHTLNLQQAKEYFNSFQSQSKHQIWKAKYTLLNSAQQIKNSVNGGNKEGGGAAPSAAPGTQINSKQEPDKKPQEGSINILIGPAKPIYTSQVDIQVQKTQKAQKVKPFVKILVTSKTEQRAKKLQTVFKECFNSFVDIFAQEQPDYADVAKNIHVNSVVSNCKTTFFITTPTEDVIQYIQILAEFYQVALNYKLIIHGHLRFQFDYDFQKFITQGSSSFYDIFAKNCRLTFDASLLNLLKSIRKALMAQQAVSNSDPVEIGILTSLVHLEAVEGNFEFQNSLGEGQTETKEELKQMLGQLGQFLNKLNNNGIKLKQLLELLDDTILVQANAGDWKGTVFLRLTNINKIFLNSIKVASQADE